MLFMRSYIFKQLLCVSIRFWGPWNWQTLMPQAWESRNRHYWNLESNLFIVYDRDGDFVPYTPEMIIGKIMISKVPSLWLLNNSRWIISPWNSFSFCGCEAVVSIIAYIKLSLLGNKYMGKGTLKMMHVYKPRQTIWPKNFNSHVYIYYTWNYEGEWIMQIFRSFVNFNRRLTV
jgi:hypothetical protein